MSAEPGALQQSQQRALPVVRQPAAQQRGELGDRLGGHPPLGAQIVILCRAGSFVGRVDNSAAEAGRPLVQIAHVGERTVGELARPFSISLAAASKHIKALESAGLVRREIRGRTHWCSLDPGPLASASEWLRHYERFWTGRLDTLERLLREDDARKAEALNIKSPEGEDK